MLLIDLDLTTTRCATYTIKRQVSGRLLRCVVGPLAGAEHTPPETYSGVLGLVSGGPCTHAYN